MYRIKNLKKQVQFNCLRIDKDALINILKLPKARQEVLIEELLEHYHYVNMPQMLAVVERHKVKSLLMRESVQNKILRWCNELV